MIIVHDNDEPITNQKAIASLATREWMDALLAEIGSIKVQPGLWLGSFPPE